MFRDLTWFEIQILALTLRQTRMINSAFCLPMWKLEPQILVNWNLIWFSHAHPDPKFVFIATSKVPDYKHVLVGMYLVAQSIHRWEYIPFIVGPLSIRWQISTVAHLFLFFFKILVLDHVILWLNAMCEYLIHFTGSQLGAKLDCKLVFRLAHAIINIVPNSLATPFGISIIRTRIHFSSFDDGSSAIAYPVLNVLWDPAWNVLTTGGFKFQDGQGRAEKTGDRREKE